MLVRAKAKTSEGRDAILGALQAATAPTMREEGALAYQSSIDSEDPFVVNAVEIFASEEALAVHSATEHAQALFAAVADIPAEVTINAFRGDMEPFDIRGHGREKNAG